jgi:hypothetical protein
MPRSKYLALFISATIFKCTHDAKILIDLSHISGERDDTFSFLVFPTHVDIFRKKRVDIHRKVIISDLFFHRPWP